MADSKSALVELARAECFAIAHELSIPDVVSRLERRGFSYQQIEAWLVAAKQKRDPRRYVYACARRAE